MFMSYMAISSIRFLSLYYCNLTKKVCWLEVEHLVKNTILFIHRKNYKHVIIRQMILFSNSREVFTPCGLPLSGIETTVYSDIIFIVINVYKWIK